MALSQMNVRIDEQVRIEGNQALESIGLTPARMVRDVWGFAAKNRNNPARLRHALRFLEDASDCDDDREERLRKAQEGWRIAETGLAAMGVSLQGIEPTPLGDLKEQAYRERWEAKGLL